MWSKPLPGGEMFSLSSDTPRAYLLHDSELGRFRLASDTIATSHRRKLALLYSGMSLSENESFHRLGYTIGGMLVFPGNRIDGKQTINQRRGTHHLIADRFDLTLECIRRHYVEESSPLSSTMSAYAGFFRLFVDFRGYVDFFLLQDILHDDGRVRMLTGAEAFASPTLPTTLDGYVAYRRLLADFVRARNRRIDSAFNGRPVRRIVRADGRVVRDPR
ncbi:hypothetical protein HQQ81_13255 [Microbacteriaceae bacterium VKM Ac-2854]|nr:hypothetical protein [Microbacteriaceae bacterium VKM Ac-2854]